MKKHAEALSDILMQIEDLKSEAAAIVEAAKNEGVNVKALKKVARELVMDSVKLQAKFDDENQLELFRETVGLLERKGLAMRQAA